MRSSLFIYCSLFILLQLPAQGIDFFHGSWEEALELAQKEDKPIFVDAYASWCGPCKTMSANVFPQAEVGAVFNTNFINMKLDMEKPEAASFRANHSVAAYPTLFFISATGETVHTVVGGQRVDGLIAQARTALSKVDDLPMYEASYQEGERDPAFVYRYVRALIRQGKPYKKIANDQLRSQKGNLTDPNNLRLMYIAATDSDSRIFDVMLQNQAAVEAEVSKESFAKQVAFAFNNTKAKAIEYNDENMLAAAAKKYSAIDAGQAADFLLRGELELALVGQDAKAVYKSAKKYYKKVAAGNATLLSTLFAQLSGSGFAKQDKKVQDIAEMVGNEAAALQNSYRDYYILARWLNDVGRKASALTAAEKSKALIPESEPNKLRLLDFLIGKINE